MFSCLADPRFEGGGGSSKLNYDIFRKAYGFLATYQDSEIEELKKSLKKEKNQVSLLADVLKQRTHAQPRDLPRGSCRNGRVAISQVTPANYSARDLDSCVGCMY